MEEEKFIDPEDLVGEEFDFYGACLNELKLDDIIYEVLEDEDDGMRSSMDVIQIKSDEDSEGIFFDRPIARVYLEEGNNESFEGYRLVDVDDGHVWLTFGTDHSDSYYPMFVFIYEPKEPDEEEE